MRVVRRGDIDCVNVRIGVEVLDRFIDLLDAILLSKNLSLGQRAVGDACKLATGKSERLGHLVGDNAAPDHSPTKLGSRKDIIGDWLVLDRSERCFCGCFGVERSLFGICHYVPPESSEVLHFQQPYIRTNARAFACICVFICLSVII